MKKHNWKTTWSLYSAVNRDTKESICECKLLTFVMSCSVACSLDFIYLITVSNTFRVSHDIGGGAVSTELSTLSPFSSFLSSSFTTSKIYLSSRTAVVRSSQSVLKDLTKGCRQRLYIYNDLNMLWWYNG